MALHDPLPPFVFPARDDRERRWIAALKQAGRLRPIGPRLYTTVEDARVAEAIRGSWSTIVSTLFPRALLSHRTALEYKPTDRGDIYLTATTNRRVAYPGLTLHFLRGPGPLDDDPTFLAMRASSRARAALENLSSRRGSRDRCVPREALDRHLEQIVQVEGEHALNALRDRAREIASQLGWRPELKRLDAIIGGLLGTRNARLASPTVRARAAGEPYDASCLNRLQLLFAELRTRPLVARAETWRAPDHVKNKAFFEAYFSNYIEGTRFEIEEAERIVFDGAVPERRPVDAQDVLRTFQIVSNPNEMRRTPRDFDDFIALLTTRHATLMEERPDVLPGRFKDQPNRAGDTRFVEPAYVTGTLRKGLELYAELRPGLPRAMFIMFLVAEVHPFVDGNGRIARVMMNAELVAQDQVSIIIPTVYRDDYIHALRALSRRERSDPVIRMLDQAQQFSMLEFTPYPAILRELQRRNWFHEPDEAKLVL